MLTFGALLVVAGVGLRGASWILPDGVLGGGVALIAAAPFARSVLDAIVVASPFLFYTRAPGGGVLTVGSTDALLPFFVFAVVAGVALTRNPERMAPRALPGAAPLAIAAAVLVTTSTVLWSMLSPDFLLLRAIADLIKLGLCAVYMALVVVLVRRGGRTVVVHALRLWALTASALSVGSLAGITGAVSLIPNDGSRSLGYFQDPNLYAGYLLLSLAVVIYLGSEPSTWLLPLQGALIVGGVVMTGSRGALVSLALLLAFAAIFINSARLRAALLLGLAAATAGFVWLLGERENGVSVLGLDRLFDASDDVGDDPRLTLWRLAIDKWLEAPLQGIGAGQFERFSTGTVRGRTSGLGYVTHNSFLYFLVAYGVLGLALFLALLWWIVRDLYRARHLTLFAKHALTAGVLVIMSQMMTLNLQNQRYVWIYFGLVLGLATLEQSGAPPPRAATAAPSTSVPESDPTPT